MKRISMLLEDISAHPFTGIGKPEALKGKLRGIWSFSTSPVLSC
ncbi:MAG: type II toxin-antitoxin system YoeB family toxin [Prevotella sp.]|nr:type II toxin-antitoxin system YoeB family toxin [Prevotella sp.]MCI7089325.1 type II toxin-antitoxin system YoeB family toxin [Prevotella sp.]